MRAKCHTNTNRESTGRCSNLIFEYYWYFGSWPVKMYEGIWERVCGCSLWPPVDFCSSWSVCVTLWAWFPSEKTVSHNFSLSSELWRSYTFDLITGIRLAEGLWGPRTTEIIKSVPLGCREEMKDRGGRTQWCGNRNKRNRSEARAHSALYSSFLLLWLHSHSLLLFPSLSFMQLCRRSHLVFLNETHRVSSD